MINQRKSHSQLCPNCHKLISTSAPICPHCQLKNPGSRLRNTIFQQTLSDGSFLIKSVIILNCLFFIISVLLDIQNTDLNFNPFSFLSPSSHSLFLLGATGTIPLFQAGHFWTLISATFLHGGVLHIAFNMVVFNQLAPIMIREFGSNRSIIIFTFGGIGGYLISSLAGVKFTIGASAAICSFIGAILFYGKSRGGVFGDAIFRQIGGWAIGIIIFGFLFPGINNWGHVGGMAVGFILGYLLQYQEKSKEKTRHRLLAMVCVGLTLVTLAFVLATALLYRFFAG